MEAVNRIKYIEKKLQQDSYIETKKIAEELKVSLMTINRDLNKMKKMGLLEIVYGGAVPPLNLTEERKYADKQKENFITKDLIANKALLFIKDDMTIFLDAGTTTYALALLLKEKAFKNLSIITNDIFIAKELYIKSNINLIFIGGKINHETASTNNITAFNQLKNYNLDIAFIGIAAISNKFELSTTSEEKSSFKKLVMEISKTKILLTDSSKFNKIKFNKFTKLIDFDYVITDYKFQELEDNEKFKEKIIKI